MLLYINKTHFIPVLCSIAELWLVCLEDLGFPGSLAKQSWYWSASTVTENQMHNKYVSFIFMVCIIIIIATTIRLG